MIGKKGLLKIYNLFNESRVSGEYKILIYSFCLDIRKLAGRLLCEATFNSDTN